MRLTFRTKLIAIVGTSALAFLVLVLASTLLSSRVQQELLNIENHYVPRVELGPTLDTHFERLRRGFQDAVAARDLEALSRTRELLRAFLDHLASARDAVDPVKATALRAALEEYHAAAYEVSRRLIDRETGEGLVEAMSAMQTKQARAAQALKEVTTFDKGQLGDAFAAASHALRSSNQVRLGISIVCLTLVIFLSVLLSTGVLRSLRELTAGLKRFGQRDFGRPIHVASRDELGDVAQDANQMAESLKRLGEERDRIDWLKDGLSALGAEIRGELEPEDLANRAIGLLARYLKAPMAVFYHFDKERVLRLVGQYAHSPGATESARSFRAGEGLVGQAALQQDVVVIADPPAEYLRVRSGLGEGPPRALVLLPLLHNGVVTGVIELALFKPWSQLSTDLLLSVRESLAIAMEGALARARTRELLAETRRQAEHLATQEEELRSSNEELQAQQEELQQTNEELKRQAEELDAQRESLEEKNLDLERARQTLEQKTVELTTVSTYKSQFLANMSHELRTPLNSMLLLSNLLAENETGKLTEKQVEFAKTIYSAGKDLLSLINQVLDLAKVEAGKQEVRLAPVALAQLGDHVRRTFDALANEKGLRLLIEIESGLPDSISTDGDRVQQILNNLLGNAIKFTKRGEVALRIHKPLPGFRPSRQDLNPDRAVALSVSDTGLGIAQQDQQRVFAPFEQVQATMGRRHGGTGLGLTIARESISLLGGELQLHSAPGEGSTFICYLPYECPSPLRESQSVVRQTPDPTRGALAPAADPTRGTLAPAANAIAKEPIVGDDDRNTLAPGDTVFLIIEDDPIFAATFGEVIRSHGLKYLLAQDGRSGLRLARERKPSGIILDVNLPDIDGWQVMKELQADPVTAAIPVHFLTAADAGERGMAMGAVGYLTKPTTRQDLVPVLDALVPHRVSSLTRLLLVESDESAEGSLATQLAGENIELLRVTTAAEALKILEQQRFNCMILDLSLPDMDGLDLLRAVEEQCASEMPSVIVYTGRALSREEAKRLEAYTEAVVIKEGPSRDRLVNEIRLFVRRLKEGLGPRRQPIPPLQRTDVQLQGRTVLLVEDDMRTLYALSATLRSKGMNVLVADTGQAALDVLAKHRDVEAVLMDIMLPEMDGYEAVRRIRQDKPLANLPIIALTAKAMKGDREKCLEAGATDYLTKPVDADDLMTMLHTCLSGKAPRAVRQ